MKNFALFFTLLFVVAANSKSSASISFNGKYLTDTVKNVGYTIFGKSAKIASIEVRKDKKSGNVLYIKIGKSSFDGANNNATGLGISGKSKSRDAQRASGPIFDKIEILSGSYEDIKVDKLSTTQNEFTLKNIKFPLRLKMHAGDEYIEFELTEAGRWDMDVRYKK